MLKITFVNSQIGYSSGGTFMRGYSSLSYGQSSWNQSLNAQAVTWTGTQEQYAVMIRDLALAWGKPMRKWVPLVIEQEAAPILPHEVQEFNAGYNLAMDGQELPDAASVAAELGYTLVKNRVALVDKIPDAPLSVSDFKTYRENASPVALTIESPVAPIIDVPVTSMAPFKAKPDDSKPLLANTPYLAINAAAKRCGVDISGCKTNVDRIALINEKRASLVTQ